LNSEKIKDSAYAGGTLGHAARVRKQEEGERTREEETKGRVLTPPSLNHRTTY
jgi:hypothetical protein